MTTTTWAIVMTAREPEVLLLANVGWHLGTGAQEVHVYLDDPLDPAAQALRAIPGVIVTLCDDAHWRALAPRRKRPESHMRRQALNANHAQNQTQCDWIVHIDADEFLLQSRPLADEMHVVKELKCELNIPVAERLYVENEPEQTIFSGVFRSSTKGLNRRADGISNDGIIFGDHLPFLVHGMLSHSAGKCAVPTGEGLRLGIHWAFLGEGRDRASRYRSTSTVLLHFDGLTKLHWLSKLLYKAEHDHVLNLADHRRAQVEVLNESIATPEGIWEYHAELREMDDAKLARYRAFGLLIEERFDPADVIEKQLGYALDLSAAAFDCVLSRTNTRAASLA